MAKQKRNRTGQAETGDAIDRRKMETPLKADLDRIVTEFREKQYVQPVKQEDKSKPRPILDKSLRHQRPRDHLKALDALVMPQKTPAAIIELDKIMRTVGELSPDKRQAFVEKVNAILAQENYCFKIDESLISKKLYFNAESNKEGAVEFQLTKGGLRGVLKTKYELIPYVFPAR